MINYYGGTVSVIDEATRAVTATIPVGTEPDGVAVDPAARTVYVANYIGVTNYLDGTVSVIDAATRAVTATIPGVSGPPGVAVDPTTRTAYVANALSDGTVSVISAALPAPVTMVTSSRNPSTFGQNVTFTATAPRPRRHHNVQQRLHGAVPRRAPDPRHRQHLPGHLHHHGPAGRPRHDHRRLPRRRQLRHLRRHAHPDCHPGPDRADREHPPRPAPGDHPHRDPDRVRAPVSGQPVSFSTGHTQLCTPDTSTRGVATCVLTASQARQAGPDHGTIRASYPGNTSYQPSSATAAPPPWWWPGV